MYNLNFVFTVVDEFDRVYALSREAAHGFRVYINELGESRLLQNAGDFSYMDETWEGPFYVTIGGRQKQINTFFVKDTIPNHAIMIDDMSVCGDYSSVSSFKEYGRWGNALIPYVKQSNHRGENMNTYNQGQFNMKQGQVMNTHPQQGQFNKQQGQEQLRIPGMSNVGQQIPGMFGFDMLTRDTAVNMDGEWFKLDKENKGLINVTGMVMEIPVSARVFPERFENIKVGDIIRHDNKTVFVVKAQKTKLTVMGKDGVEATVVGIKNNLMGDVVFVEKIMNMMENFGFGGEGSEGGMDKAMMIMATLSQQGQQGQQGMNPMAMMAFMGMMK